jgi:hypothetical protein
MINIGRYKLFCMHISRMSLSLLEKAAAGKIPVYFVLAHGKDYSPSQSIRSVPTGKLLILPVDLGDTLTYAGAEALAKMLGDKSSINKLLSNLPKKFTVLKQTEQFPDTILAFHDRYLWTGIYELPQPILKRGLRKEIHSMMNIDTPNTPPKKRVSTFLNENPNEEAVYIIASCRGVKNVPPNEVSGLTTKYAKRTSAQIKTLTERKKEAMRKSKKRPASLTKSTGKKKAKIDPSKKRKRSPDETSRKKQKLNNSPVKSLTQKMSKLQI